MPLIATIRMVAGIIHPDVMTSPAETRGQELRELFKSAIGVGNPAATEDSYFHRLIFERTALYCDRNSGWC